MVAALIWVSAAFAFPSHVGPVSSHFPGQNGSDLCWEIGMMVGGGEQEAATQS